MKLELDRLNGFEYGTTIAGHFSAKTGANKKINVVSKVELDGIKSEFAVISHGETLATTDSLENAVDLFNTIK